jgi:hypothetical protein
MLVDGASVAGIASVSAWMQDGHGYASADLAGNLPIPWTILCNANTGVCTGTVSGNVTQVFANGKQIGEFSLLLYFDRVVVVVLTRFLQRFGVGLHRLATATRVSATVPLTPSVTQLTRC